MTKFFCKDSNSNITNPEEVAPFLKKKDQWKKGRSAYELAHKWMDADGIPDQVLKLLNTKNFRNSTLIEAYFERETKMPGRGAGSNTDLLAICEASGIRFVMGVEGKVDEEFGCLVSKYKVKPNRQKRFKGIVDVLGGDYNSIGNLRYQLLHRTASAVIEARQFGVSKAIMLVHSFDPHNALFEDFKAFASWLNINYSRRGVLSDPVHLLDVDLFLGWVTDKPKL